MAKQYPDIHLAPGYFWNAGSAGENDWQLGATVELPLLNRHRGPIAEAAARREASAARFLALQAKVITEIDGAVASFRASQTNFADRRGPGCRRRQRSNNPSRRNSRPGPWIASRC